MHGTTSPKGRLKEGWSKLQETAGNIKDKVADPMKDKADEWLGVWIFKNIATLFYWDEHVQGWVFGGYECPQCRRYTRDSKDKCGRCGNEDFDEGEEYKGIIGYAHEDTEKAAKEGEFLKTYLIHRANNDRKYQSKLDEVVEKLEGKQDLLKSKFEKLKDKKFLKWLKKEGE